MITFEAVRVEMKKESYYDLVDFLKSREGDIAWEIEDFGQLTGLFISLIGREPVKEYKE